MKRFIACVMAFIMCFSCALAEDTSIDEQLAKLFRGHKTTGATLVVAKEGKIVYEYYYGYADKKTQDAVDADTCFRTASVTKLISGIHVMQLVEQGLLDLDESIGTYLGYEVKNHYHPEVPVTLRQLMSHTSSLNPNGGYSRTGRTLRQLLDAENNAWGNWYDEVPGSKYRYSNFGAGVMGSLVEAVTGKNINDSVTEGLFAPLEINAAYHPSLLSVPDNAVSQYDPAGKQVKSRQVALDSEWDPRVDPDNHYRITVGSVWINGRDLCRLGIMMAQTGMLDNTRILKPATVQLMMADQKGQGYVKANTPYGLCVNRVDNLLDDRMVYGHQGLSDGVLCNLYWDPQTQLVFALITNGSSVNMNDRIGKLSRKTFAVVWEAFGE